MGIQPSEMEWDRTLKALEDANGNQTQAALALGLARSTLQNRIAQARAQGRLPDSLSLEGFQVKKVSTYYGREGERTGTWVQEVPGVPSVEEIASQVARALQDYTPPRPLKTALKAPPTEVDLATVYPQADLHWGLRSWQPESGHNYDIQIARDTLEPTVTQLIEVSPPSSVGVFLGLGDLHHSDNFLSTTTKGTPQDTDGRFPKTLYESTQYVLFSTDLLLQKHHNVLIVILPGNHDEVSAVAIRLALSLHYRDHPRVTVSEDAGRFWWWEWGKVFLGATHGDKAKMKDMALVMAARNPEAWGRTKFRHCLTGHIHQDSMRNDHGVKVESFETPVPPDAYTAAHGYDSGRSMQAITYHKERGEILRQRVNL